MTAMARRPAQWERVLDRCSAEVAREWPELTEAPKPSPQGLQGGFLFSGTQHETVPRRLLLDNRLTPLERNAWQVFRLLLDKDGIAVPRYEDLQPYLSTVPYGTTAARETVARALTILRLTRWLSLVVRGRDQSSGRIRGSLYILHDEPVTPAEAMELDDEYLALVGSCLSHANKAVRIVAQGAMTEISQDTLIEESRLPTRLDTWGQRWALQGLDEQGEYSNSDSERCATGLVRNGETPSSESELGESDLVRNAAEPSSESEQSLESSTYETVRNPNSACTVRTVLNTNTGTVPRARAARPVENLRWPDSIRLTPTERQAANLSLAKLDAGIRQAVLDEAGIRCASGSVRSPCRYLMGLIQKALKGDFNPWVTTQTPRPHASPTSAASSTQPFTDSVTPAPPSLRPTEPLSEQVQSCLQELRQLTRKQPSG